MNIVYKILFVMLLLPSNAHASGKSLIAVVENPGGFERKNETIAVPLKNVRERLKGVDVGRFAVIDRKAGTIVISQTTSDELLFKADFEPRERRTFIIRQSEAEGAAPHTLVDGRFVLPREDFAWENDRIAFRMYGPALAAEVNNGIDVWTKRVRSLVVAKWYKESEGSLPGKDTYHQDRGEGADFFAVGRSLGAGGSGIWRDGKVWQPGVFSSYTTLCNGPIRVAFELTYATWDIGGKKFTERKRISLDAGENLNRIEVSFSGLAPMDTVKIACGLVKRNYTTASTGKLRKWMSVWGLTNSDSVNGYLGTGVVLPATAPATFTEDNDQYLLISNTIPGSHFVYYAGAGWTRSGDFMTAAQWEAYLTNFSRRLDVPMKLSITMQK
jgi:pectinesterase